MLKLTLAPSSGRVQISCDDNNMQHLEALKNRYGSAVTIDPLSFNIQLDDFLLNLYELTGWPDADTDVRWQAELLELVKNNDSDAETLRERLREDSEATHHIINTVSLSDGWIASLTDFQSRDIGKLLGLAHGANFSVPGAGKTRVTLATFQARKDRGEVERMLVICPKAAFESWLTEAELCFGGTPPTMDIMDTNHPPEADIVLLNYERLPGAQNALSTWLAEYPSLLVLDEAHRMKRGSGGAWGSACLALGPHAKRRLILTGTPVPNGAADLENLFAFVWPGLGRAQVSQALAGRDLHESSRLLSPLFVRTTKNELQLPPVEREVRRIELPPFHREIYNALLGQFTADTRGGEDDIEALGRVLLYLIMAATTPALLAAGASPHEPLPYRIPPIKPTSGSSLSELMRDLPHYELSPKYKEVAAIVSENAKAGRKTLVWSTFVRNLKSLERFLKNFNPAIIHGGSDNRKEHLRRFREDQNCMLLLSNPATLGEGVSLHQVCHDAVYLDRDFAAGRFLQSLDRIHRLGLPSDTVTRVTVLVCTATIDELIEQRLATKLRFMGGVLDDPAVLELSDLNESPVASAGMDSEDLQELLSYLRGAPPS